MYQLQCKDCGELFMSQGHNSRFCPDCASRRKKAQDHASWVRRKKQEEEIRIMAGGETINQLERRHALELGLSKYYYNLFKSQNRNTYCAWLKREKETETKRPESKICFIEESEEK